MHMTRSFAKLALAVLFIRLSQGAIAADTTTLSTLTAPKKSAPITKLDDLLEAKDAFKPQLRQRDAFTAELKFDIAPGYYLYRDRLRVEHMVATPAAASTKSKDKSTKSAKPAAAPTSILALSAPSGKPVDDPTFGKVEVYETSATILIDLSKFNRKKEEDVRIALISQGCAIAGVCFPPQKQLFTLKYKPTLSTPGNWSGVESESAISFGKSGLSSIPAGPARSPAKSPL